VSASSETAGAALAQRLRLTVPIQAQSAVLLLIAAAGSWSWLRGVHSVNLTKMGDLGIVSLLPPGALVGVVTLGVCFFAALTGDRRSGWLLAALTVTGIVLLYGLNAMVEPEARFNPVWRHAGYVDYVLRHGGSNTRIDAYFSWPGFFLALAFLLSASGIHSTESLLAIANWVPLLFNLSYAITLYAIFSALTEDRRVRWLALWIFLVNNWFGQDYLAPQAMAFELYLIIVAMVLWWLRVSSPWPSTILRFIETERRSPPLDRRRLLLLVPVLGVFVAAVISHPLTPLFTIVSITLLVVFAGVRPWWLPPLMLAILVGWDAVMTRDYLAGHSSELTDAFGGVTSKVNQNVGSRLTGSPDHVFVVTMRVWMTALLWAMALVGAVRAIVARKVLLPAFLLAVAPLPLFAVQSYGGEMLIRIQFFSLPFVSFLAAGLLSEFRPRAWRSLARTAAVFLISLVMLLGFLVTRFGNERQDYYTPAEVRASQHLYEIAPAGSLLVWGPTPPVRYRDIEKYSYYELGPRELNANDLGSLEHRLRALHGKQTLVLITRAEKAYSDMSSGLPPASLDQFQTALELSANWEVVYRNPDAEILRLRAPGSQ
jgi:hypothetical protein